MLYYYFDFLLCFIASVIHILVMGLLLDIRTTQRPNDPFWSSSSKVLARERRWGHTAHVLVFHVVYRLH